MNNKNLIRYIRNSLFIVAGIFIGWLFFHTPHKSPEKDNREVETSQVSVWTCAMHPQIRKNAPGKCPICGMDLIPLDQNNAEIVAEAIHLTKEAAQLANVLTSVVTRQKPVKEVRLYGKVQADERLLQNQVSHIPGRIEKLLVNFTGERVSKGEILALIYSPELITAQQELLEAVSMKESQPAIYEAAKEKLRQWKLPESQIISIENSGIIQNNSAVVSNTSGIVTSRRVNNGDYIAQGTVLYEVADLSRVWVMFDAYESDLPFLEIGDKLTFTVQALPGISFAGKIIFIDPAIDPVTRVAKVRIEINNGTGRLKPEMFATGIVTAGLKEYQSSLVIPASAVLWTGKRSIVYVKQPGTDEPVFKFREVELGPVLGNDYIITKGLSEGEEIVTQGTFSIDAASQLAGKPSMMNPSGGKVPDGHAGMDMGENDKNNESPGTITKDHEGHNSEENSSQSMDMSVDIRFKEQLTFVYEKYLKIKDALVSDDLTTSKSSATEMYTVLKKVDMSLVKGEDHNHWMELSGRINVSLEGFRNGGSLEAVRKLFMDLSIALANAIKMYGLKDKTVYYQFCPMADDNKGAYWLSQLENIRNPYFGAQMLTCGETKEILK